jgi:PilZ domain
MPEDQRRHLRLPVESTVFIELVSPGIGSVDSGKVAICKTLDVSRGGLRVSLEHELVVGAILQVGIELPDAQDTLYLAGEVRWCLANHEPETGWSAGFALLNAGDSDIDSWVALLTGMEN